MDHIEFIIKTYAILAYEMEQLMRSLENAMSCGS